jgi:hypothetical protein
LKSEAEGFFDGIAQHKIFTRRSAVHFDFEQQSTFWCDLLTWGSLEEE